MSNSVSYATNSFHHTSRIAQGLAQDITGDLIDRDWAPKVHGAWHLHNATAGQPLDWFCSFSSAAALVGSPGQGAYAAANSFILKAELGKGSAEHEH